MAQEHVVASIVEKRRAMSCWGCGLRLILPPSGPVFKCSWCGAITNQNPEKRDNKWFCWRRLRDRCFVSFMLVFMLFLICGAVCAVFPIIYSIGLLHGLFHSAIAIILAVTTVLTFTLSAFRGAGTPPTVMWGSYPVVGKGGLDNYTYCRHCLRPKSPRTHHCRSCGICILDMDHHCPFIGNCVGAENQQHFIAFLVSAVAGTTYAAAMSVYAGLQVWQPLRTRHYFHLLNFSNDVIVSNAMKDVVLDWLSATFLRSGRGLVLVYLFLSTFSVTIGLSILLWQQLSHIYEGKTYIDHLSSREDENVVDRDCENIIRFLGCPSFVSRYSSSFQTSPKRHMK